MVLRIKLIITSIKLLTILSVFFLSSNLVSASNNNEETMNKQVSNKSSDLLIHRDGTASSQETIEYLKQLSFFTDVASIEIGEFSCYSRSAIDSIYFNDLPSQTLTLSMHTQTQIWVVKLEESSNTALSESLKSFCNEIINISHESNYLARQLVLKIRELEASVYIKNTVTPSGFELNVQDSWNRL